MNARGSWLTFAPGLLLALPMIASAASVDFDRDVRPILATNCYKCHGPDHQARKAGLRLDTQTGATHLLRSGDRAIVPGKPTDSALYQRITSKETDE